MINYILQPPAKANAQLVLVITEGLNDQTIFRRYLKAFGPGIHHVAYTVKSAREAFHALRSAGYKTTAEQVTRDMLTGLEQFFIDASHGGFFIECIERTAAAGESDGEAAAPGFFTGGNMAELAHSMATHLQQQISAEPMKDLLLKQPSSGRTHAADADGGTALGEHGSRALSGEHHPPEPPCGVVLGEIRELHALCDKADMHLNFLCTALGFRFVRLLNDGERTGFLLSLPAQPSHTISLWQQNQGQYQRLGIQSVGFATPDIAAAATAASFWWSHHRVCHSGEDSGVGIRGLDDGSADFACVAQATYGVRFLGPTALGCTQVTRLVSAPSAPLVPPTLSVDLLAKPEKVLAFLSNLENFSSWTAHRSLHRRGRAGGDDDWVELRKVGEGGALQWVGIEARVEMGSGGVSFHWGAPLSYSVHIGLEAVGGTMWHAVTRLTLPLPVSSGEARRAAELTSLLAAELGLLKAILERDMAHIDPYLVHDRERVYRYSAKLLGSPSLCPSPPTHAELAEFRFGGELITNGEYFQAMSHDFALAVRSQPLAVLKVSSVDDVCAVIRLSSARGLRVGARGSRVSHAAGGQSQADGGLVLDLSLLNGVRLGPCGADGRPTYVDAEGGAMWAEVLRVSLAAGMMPPVVLDYQQLTVGGTLSTGGISFMSHLVGVQAQASHVLELDVVTGEGELLTCHSQQSAVVYDAVRGGLGAFGVITRARIVLVPAPERLSVVRLFYSHAQLKRFLSDVELLVKQGQDLLHAFLKPCSRNAVTKLLSGGGTSAEKDQLYESAPASFRKVVEASEGPLVYLEVGIYHQGSLAASVVEAMLAPLSPLGHMHFVEETAFLAYWTRDPPVIEGNKERGVSGHPSVTTILPAEKALAYLERCLHPPGGDISTTECLITPLVPSTLGHCPMFAMPERCDLAFFILCICAASPPTPEVLGPLLEEQRLLQLYSRSLGGKRYPYDSHNDVGEEAWEEHYGSAQWERVRAAKRLCDPAHVLGCGVHMFGN